MPQNKLKNRKSLKERADDFLVRWHKFPIDYWWRKKYHIAFGSSQHREMSLIDMFLEYKEELNMIKDKQKIENDEADANSMRMSQEEIDDDYENLDLDSFDNL